MAWGYSQRGHWSEVKGHPRAKVIIGHFEGKKDRETAHPAALTVVQPPDIYRFTEYSCCHAWLSAVNLTPKPYNIKTTLKTATLRSFKAQMLAAHLGWVLSTHAKFQPNRLRHATGALDTDVRTSVRHGAGV